MVRLFLSSTTAAVAGAALTVWSGLAPAEAATAAKPDFDHVSCRGLSNEVQVEIRGVKESAGLMNAELYLDDDDGFLKKRGRIQRVRFAAKAPVTRFCVRAPASGRYAIAVYHDRNANEALDRRAFGLPAEPYGISNNPVIRFAPPSVKEALFDVAKEGVHVEIKLKN